MVDTVGVVTPFAARALCSPEEHPAWPRAGSLRARARAGSHPRRAGGCTGRQEWPDAAPQPRIPIRSHVACAW